MTKPEEVKNIELLNKMRSSDVDLINLIPQIPSALFKDVLEITDKVSKSATRAGVLNKLIPRIDDSSLFLEAFRIAIETEQYDSRSFILEMLKSQLRQNPDLLPKVESLKLAEDFLSTKDYYACSEILITVIPYLSRNLRISALKTAYKIDDNTAKILKEKSLIELENKLSKSLLQDLQEEYLYADWSKSSDDWKIIVAEEYKENKRWKLRQPGYYEEYSHNFDLALWRATGNEIIDHKFCKAARARAKVLALLYYCFSGKEQNQIFEELVKAIDEIPAKSCKVRSFIALIPNLPDLQSRNLANKSLLLLKEIIEDINSNTNLKEEDINEKIQNLEQQFESLAIYSINEKLFDLVEYIDSIVFPYPIWWTPKMVEGLPPKPIPSQSQSQTLLRYPYIECPQYSPIKQLFTIYVKLLVKSPESGTAGMLISEPKILIVLRAPSFKIVEPINQEKISNTKVIEVHPCNDTIVPFFLIPTESGFHEIQVDFIRNGMPIVTITQNIEITTKKEFANNKEPEPQLTNIPAVDFNNPFPVQQADLELRIQLKKQQQRLVFYLTSNKIDYFYKEIGEVELQDSLENIIQSFYKELGTIASNSRKLGSSDSDYSSDNFQDNNRIIQNILKRTGNRLWKELIPDGLKEKYWEFKSSVKSLLIISDEPWIPWEITKPYKFNKGKQEQEPFWCEQFAISRWLSGPGVANLCPIDPADLAIPIAPNNTNLSWAQQEATFVKELNQSCVSVNIESIPIISRVLDLEDYLEENQNQFSILHFACHGMFNTTSPDDSAIQLSDCLLRPSDMYLDFSHKSLRPMVFINACHGARVGFSLTQIGGWAKQFVDAKVAVFIGAMWEVDDEIAFEFAQTFYTKLRETDDIAIAEAFQQTRKAIREKYPNNSTWLAYSLYAHPEARIIQPAN